MTNIAKNIAQQALLLGLMLLCGCQRGPKAYIEKGNQMTLMGKYGEAILNYENALKQDPKSDEAHYRMAAAMEKSGLTGFAFREYTAAQELALGRDDIRVDQSDLALSLYSSDPRKPKALYDQVANTANLLLKKNPDSFDGLRFEAAHLVMDGKLAEAIELYRKANELKPLDPKIADPMVQALFSLKQDAEGEKLAEKLLEAHKDFAHIYDILSAHYLQVGRPSEAERILKSKVANFPRESYPILLLASFYQRAGRDQEMSQTLQTLLADSRDFPQAHALVGDFYAGIGKLDDALSEYSIGSRTNTKERALYQKRIAKVLITQGKRDDAIAQLDQVLKSDGTDADSRLARAILLRETNDPKRLDQAISELNIVLAGNRNDAVARHNLGLAYLAKGDAKGANTQFVQSAQIDHRYAPPLVKLAEMAQLAHNYPEVIRLTNEVLQFDPENFEARVVRCAGLIGSKSYLQARSELGTLLRQYPNSLAVHLHMAALDTAEKRYKDAERRYLSIYRPGKGELQPLEGLIQVYLLQHQMDKATKLVEAELQQSPDSKSLHGLMGSAAASGGYMELAVREYEWLRDHDPMSPIPYEVLGDLYRLKGDSANALSNYRKANEMDPSNSQVIAFLAYVESLTGQDQAAISELKRQLKLDPENTIAQNNLAMALAETGTDLDQALSLAEKVQRKLPNNPGVSDTLAWVYTKKGLYDSATRTFRSLIKKYPNEPIFRYHLAVALLQQGKPAEAKSELTIGLSKKPAKDLADKMAAIAAKLG